MKRRIPYTKPSIAELEVSYATDAAANGWGEHCYDYSIRFEDAVRAHLGVDYLIATSSCTGALPMTMAALGINRGHQAIQRDTNRLAFTHQCRRPTSEPWSVAPAARHRQPSRPCRRSHLAHTLGRRLALRLTAAGIPIHGRCLDGGAHPPLSEVYHMLAENVETWTDQWKREGVEQGLEQGREATRRILVRLVRRRFGSTVAQQTEPLLARIADLRTLEDLGDQLLISADGNAWLLAVHNSSAWDEH